MYLYLTFLFYFSHTLKHTIEEFREQCLQKRDHLLSLPEPFSVQ